MITCESKETNFLKIILALEKVFHYNLGKRLTKHFGGRNEGNH
jgi:hypothetical protein